MQIKTPALEEGRVYDRSEVEAYIGTQTGSSDYNVVKAHFPRNLVTWEFDLQGFRSGEEMLVQYKVIPMAAIEKQIRELEATFDQHEQECQRVNAIIEALRRGEPVYPVFLQHNDPQQRIIEGMHRCVALLKLNSPNLPAFLTGYRNWFFPDEPLDGFDREDEIVRATLRDVYGFFLDATRIDHKGIQLALFGGDRLSLCDDAFVARFRGRVVGAITISVAKGRPTLSTVYVLRQCRRCGVSYRLCETALQMFERAGIKDVHCEVQSPGMEATLKRLGHERPELRALLRAQIAYLSGEDIEIGLGEDDCK